MLDLPLALVFGAGILSFLSPCVLPLVPAYLTYMSGASLEQMQSDGAGAVWRRGVVTAFFFVFGFSLVFVALGATATAFGLVFRSILFFEIGVGTFRFALVPALAGLMIIAMGLHFLGVFRLGFLNAEIRHGGPAAASGPLGGFLLGLAFAIGWTPCIGPVLAAILSVAASRETAGQGALLLAVYSAGLGVPFLLAGMALGPFLTFFQSLKRHLGMVEKVMGAILVLVGLMFLSGQLTQLSYWVLETFPVLSNFG